MILCAVELPGLRCGVVWFVVFRAFLDVEPDWLQADGFSLRREPPGMHFAIGPIHINQAHDDVRVPMKAVAVDDVLGMIEIVPGVLDQGGIGRGLDLVLVANKDWVNEAELLRF